MASLYVDDGYVASSYTQTGITIIWATKEIFVPKTESELLQLEPTEIRRLDLNYVRQTLDDIMDSEEGIVNATTHDHYPPVEVGGVALARVFAIKNGYTCTFEDGQYAVNLVGANTNLADVTNVNQVSVRPNNSAGLVDNSASATDITAPTWASTVGITDAYQTGTSINISWGAAQDRNEVRYSIFISKFDVDLFNDANLLTSTDGHLYRINSDGVEPLQANQEYFIGVRAYDRFGNTTTNTNYASVTYIPVTSLLTEAQHDALMATRFQTKQVFVNEGVALNGNGTALSPFNNLEDAQATATAMGIQEIILIGDTTLTSLTIPATKQDVYNAALIGS